MILRLGMSQSASALACEEHGVSNYLILNTVLTQVRNSVFITIFVFYFALLLKMKFVQFKILLTFLYPSPFVVSTKLIIDVYMYTLGPYE